MPISIRYVVSSTILLLAVGFVTLLGIVGMTIWLNERARVYFDDVIEARDTRSAAVELRAALQTAESAQRGYMVSGNEIYLAPYDTAKSQIQRHLDEVKGLLKPYPETAVMLQRLTVLVRDKVAEMDQSIGLKNDRRDEEALALLLTNRGKALMDEINVFMTGLIRNADERLTAGVGEQRENASRLYWASILGAILIVLVVAGVVYTVSRYTVEIRQARDEVRTLASGLEARVASRTADLAQARDRAEMLLAEVNHRVANSLTLVASLTKLQSNALSGPARAALDETHARIMAIGEVHKRLYGSGDVRFVALDEYLSSLLDQLAASMHNAGHGAWLKYDVEPIRLPPDASVNLGVVVTELVTNAFKYAYPGANGEVRVALRSLGDGRAELLVEDDGVGRRADSPIQGTGVGTRLVTAMAGTLRAEIDYRSRSPGTSARLVFPVPPTC
ncbi:MAG: CHASE3 domain-containing protein [Proteobacteria bacterium]|nr:CHASE3 domain-containing protein [Pseudomonadota bacterium]